MLNVTIVEPCADGFATVYPAGAPNPPLASNSNYRTFENVAAMATTKLGAGGAVSIYTSAQADVVVDVVGYVHPTQGSLFNAVTPSRVYDVRPARLVAGQEVTIPVRGVGTVPSSAGVTGAVLNLTVNAPSGAGFLTIYPGPCSPGARPLASSLNYVAGQTVANAVVTALGANGSVCVFSLVGAEVILDATGWLGGSGSGFFGVAAQRLVDTRPGEGAMHLSIKGRVQPGRATRGAGRTQLRCARRLERRRAERHRRSALGSRLPHCPPVRRTRAHVHPELRRRRHPAQHGAGSQRRQRPGVPVHPAAHRRRRRPARLLRDSGAAHGGI